MGSLTDHWVQVSERYLHELYDKIEKLEEDKRSLQELLEMKPTRGLEPRTPALRERCSTN